jgi:hypothetical protein
VFWPAALEQVNLRDETRRIALNIAKMQKLLREK